jgi:hypothetical protein
MASSTSSLYFSDVEKWKLQYTHACRQKGICRYMPAVLGALVTRLIGANVHAKGGIEMGTFSVGVTKHAPAQSGRTVSEVTFSETVPGWNQERVFFAPAV